jgi:hypothetical protein
MRLSSEDAGRYVQRRLLRLDGQVRRLPERHSVRGRTGHLSHRLLRRGRVLVSSEKLGGHVCGRQVHGGGRVRPMSRRDGLHERPRRMLHAHLPRERRGLQLSQEDCGRFVLDGRVRDERSLRPMPEQHELPRGHHLQSRELQHDHEHLPAHGCPERNHLLRGRV